MNNEAETYIFKYIDAIFAFEKALIRTYNLNGLPYNEQNKFPQKGNIIVDGKKIDFSFHGNGCTFNDGKVEIGYSIYPDRENYIVTGPFEFMQYINSTDSERHLEQTEAYEYLQELKECGVVKKIFEDYFAYEIDLRRYKKARHLS